VSAHCDWGAPGFAAKGDGHLNAEHGLRGEAAVSKAEAEAMRGAARSDKRDAYVRGVQSGAVPTSWNWLEGPLAWQL
jgi:hypothetical protein